MSCNSADCFRRRREGEDFRLTFSGYFYRSLHLFIQRQTCSSLHAYSIIYTRVYVCIYVCVCVFVCMYMCVQECACVCVSHVGVYADILNMWPCARVSVYECQCLLHQSAFIDNLSQWFTQKYPSLHCYLVRNYQISSCHLTECLLLGSLMGLMVLKMFGPPFFF